MTESRRQLGIFVAQTSASWAVLMLIGVVSIAIESPPYDGGIAAIGWPIGGAIVCVLTNVVVVALGLGFRFFETTGRWLETHGEVAIAVAVSGLVAIVVSFLLGGPVTNLDDLGQPVPGYDPLWPLYVTGWFVTALGIVHTWPPGYLPRSGASRTLTA